MKQGEIARNIISCCNHRDCDLLLRDINSLEKQDKIAFQAVGREFESRFPLQNINHLLIKSVLSADGFS